MSYQHHTPYPTSPARKVVVEQLIFAETGTYNDVHMRPYGTEVNPGICNDFNIHTRGHTNITSEALLPIAGQILRPSAISMGISPIEHGWGNQRLRFMMRVAHISALGKSVQIITGYTDRYEVSLQGSIDPNTQMYFNNVITTTVMKNQSIVGGETSRMVDASQVLRPSLTDPFGAQEGYTMRPVDINEYARGQDSLADVSDYMGEDVKFRDVRVGFSPNERIKLSARGNTIPSRYLSRVMEGYSMAAENSEDDMLASSGNIMDRAGGLMAETTLLQSGFLNTMAQSGSTMFEENQCVTYGELMALVGDSELDARTTLVQRAPIRQLPDERGQTADLSGSDLSTVVANILSSTVPSLAIENTITKIWFSATNDTDSGRVVSQLEHQAGDPPRSFSEGNDYSNQIRRFMTAVERYVMNDITHNNQIAASVSMRYDALGDSFMSISVNGEPRVDYVIPTFCDSLFSPVYGPTEEHVAGVSHDIIQLMGFNANDYNLQNETGIDFGTTSFKTPGVYSASLGSQGGSTPDPFAPTPETTFNTNHDPFA